MIYGFSSEGSTNGVVDRAVTTGVHLARGPEFNTSQSVASLESVVLYAAQRSVKLLLLANGSSPDMPIGNLVAMIQRVGPAGTLWSGGNAQYVAYAPTHIECGNEWSYSYRGDPATNAVGVANTVKRFYDAVGPTLGANAMKFICEGEDASSGTDAFLNSLVATQPNIRNMVDGWVIHGYGPQIQEHSTHWGYPNYQRLHNRLNARGWTTDKIWITENGISSDNGPTMTQGGSPNNYGFKVNCTYAEAGQRILDIARHHGNTAPWASRVYCYLQYQAFDQQASGSGQREHYFGIYKSDGSAKGAITSAAITLALEFPTVAVPPTTTPVPGGAVAGGNAPSDSVPSEAITFVSQVGTSFLPAADPWVVQGPGSGQSGDFVVIGFSQAAQAPTVVSAPAGFTSNGTATEGTDGRLRIYYGYWSTVGAGPYSFDMSGSASGYAVCAYYRGVRSTTPLDATSIYSATSPSTAWATGTITPANTGAMIVTIAVCSPNAVGRTTTITAPAIKRGGAENGAASLYVIGDRLLTTIAATNIAGTITPAESMALGVLALRAAPVAPPTGVTETPGRGAATATGSTPAIARCASPPSASTAQGIGTATPVYTSLVTYPSLTNYPSPFVGLKVRSGVIPGGAPAGGFAPPPGGPVSQTPIRGAATAGGFAPPTAVSQTPVPGAAVAGGFAPPTGAPVSQTPTRGAATAGGLGTASVPVYPNATTYPGAATFPGATGVTSGVTARTLAPRGAATAGGAAPADIQAALPGGAIADGRPPAPRASAVAGGAVAAGQVAGDRTTALPGGATADGRALVARSALTAGGAISAGTGPGERIGVSPTPGGAVAAGTAPVVRSAVAAAGFIADGFSAPVGPKPRAAVPQGGAGAAGNEPVRDDATPQGGAAAAGTAPTARISVPPGEAVAEGFTFSVPPAAPVTVPGDSIADGTEPTARTSVTVGDATAAGTAPTPQTSATPEPGGAAVGANAPTARVAPGAGASSGEGNAPGSSAALTAGGATADGLDQQASESVTPIPGGAEADGTGPSAWTTIEFGGAIAATNQLTGATVLITPGGAIAGALVPGAPFTVSRHFDDDDGPVLVGAFDSGSPGGQT